MSSRCACCLTVMPEASKSDYLRLSPQAELFELKEEFTKRLGSADATVRHRRSLPSLSRILN